MTEKTDSDDELVEKIKTWDVEIPFDVADWGDRTVTYEGEGHEERARLYPEQYPDLHPELAEDAPIKK